MGRSAERGIQVGGPRRLPSDVGSPHVEGQCALPRGGGLTEQVWGQNQRSALDLYVCVCVKPQRGERHRLAPKHGPEPSPPGCLVTHTQQNFPPGRASPPEHRERRPERRRPLPGRRDDLRRARTDVAPAQGPTLRRRLYVITCATPRRAAWGLLFRKVQEWDRQGRCPWPSWQKVPLVSKSC